MLAAALGTSQASAPIDLGTLTLDAAEKLHGRRIVARVLVGKPVVTTSDGRTSIGAADAPDGVERGAVLPGERLDVEEGDRVMVVGELRVIRHGAAVVNGRAVQGWVEIRVEEEGHRSAGGRRMN